MMPAPLVAIGIDAPPTDLLDAWIAAGRLPLLQRLQTTGASASYSHTKRFRNERCWDLLLYGRDLGRSGSTFLPDRYGYHNDSPQRDSAEAPFYALGAGRRVCMFDLPAPLVDGVDGLQVSGWGSELNAAAALSSPPGLIHELVRQHGPDPKLVGAARVLDAPSGAEERSYVLPSLYDHEATQVFKQRLLLAVQRRTQIMLDLLRRDHWDLFIALYVECHSANHALWHLGEAHPLHDAASGHGVLDVLQAIDRSLAQILEALPAGHRFMVYTIDHTVSNTMDLPSMALLPELLHRWCFDGQAALAPGVAGSAPPPLRRGGAQHWKHAVWALCTALGQQRLESPTMQQDAGDALSWNPANWYRPLWPQMRAFALPSVADGYIRLNVRGREARGLVEAQDFGAVLDELDGLLRGLVNPRTGGPLVAQVLPMRRRPDEAPELAPDLVVCWSKDAAADMADSPQLHSRGGPGRIGPLPFFRSGGHVAHGSRVDNRCWLIGPGVAAGSRWRDGHLTDLAPTLLGLIGANPGMAMTGRPLGP